MPKELMTAEQIKVLIEKPTSFFEYINKYDDTYLLKEFICTIQNTLKDDKALLELDKSCDDQTLLMYAMVTKDINSIPEERLSKWVNENLPDRSKEKIKKLIVTQPFALNLLIIEAVRKKDFTFFYQLTKERWENFFSKDQFFLNLSRANLKRADFWYAKLLWANLLGADFQEAYFQGVDFQNTNLQGTNFQNANLQGTNFQWADFQGANLQGANFQNANLINANLQKANFREANFQNANLETLDLRNANLQGMNFQHANLGYAQLQGADLQGANLQWTDLRSANLIGANFQNANLQGAILYLAYLQGTNFQNANLQGTDLKRADLKRANLRGANLQEAKLQWTDLQGADLQGMNFQHADLEYANLQGANLQGANFQNANLQGTNFQNADLQRANLKGADLQGANFVNAIFNKETIFPAEKGKLPNFILDIKKPDSGAQDLKEALDNLYKYAQGHPQLGMIKQHVVDEIIGILGKLEQREEIYQLAYKHPFIALHREATLIKGSANFLSNSFFSFSLAETDSQMKLRAYMEPPSLIMTDAEREAARKELENFRYKQL